jgi:hypothetical protein
MSAGAYPMIEVGWAGLFIIKDPKPDGLEISVFQPQRAKKIYLSYLVKFYKFSGLL